MYKKIDLSKSVIIVYKITMEFDYPLRTTFIYLFGQRCYLLDYLGRGGYENTEYKFFVTYPNGTSHIQVHSGHWLVQNIQNEILHLFSFKTPIFI